MNNASYVKEQTLVIPAKRFTLTGIPALKSVQLSFYQKYIILLLQKRVKAADIDELAQILSAIINVSVVCVKEFLEYLQKEKYLVYWPFSREYALAEALHVQINPSMNNAMFADLDVQEADCDKIIYLEEINRFYSESDLPPEIFRRKELQTSPAYTQLAATIESAIDKNRDDIEKLVTKVFKDSNVHLLPDVVFNLKNGSCRECQLEFEALIRYQYSSETKEARKVETVVDESNVLPKEYIDRLSAGFSVDKKLPRFIALDESFYQKILPNVDAISDCEDKLSTQYSELRPLQEAVASTKKDLATTKQQYMSSRKVKEGKVKKIADNIRDVDNKIEKRQSIIANIEKSGSTDTVESLRDDIRELLEKKQQLSQEVEENEASLKALEQDYKQKESAFNQTLHEKEAMISTINEEVESLNIRKNNLEAECKTLLSSNNTKIHPVIRVVLEKYPENKNHFNRYVEEECLMLDYALSASEHDAFDELWLWIDKVRHVYQKSFFAIYSTVLREKRESLGSYLGNAYSQVHIQDWFRVKRIPITVFNNLLAFHTLVTASTHGTENGPKSSHNKKQIEIFKSMTRTEREGVLLSIPSFFNSVEFTESEVKEIIKKLKI